MSNSRAKQTPSNILQIRCMKQTFPVDLVNYTWPPPNVTKCLILNLWFLLVYYILSYSAVVTAYSCVKPQMCVWCCGAGTLPSLTAQTAKGSPVWQAFLTGAPWSLYILRCDEGQQRLTVEVVCQEATTRWYCIPLTCVCLPPDCRCCHAEAPGKACSDPRLWLRKPGCSN